MHLQIGDWVQAKSEQTEEGFNGERLWTHAKCGAIGHVMHIEEGFIVTVYWEHACSTSTVDIDDLVWIADYNTGKHAIGARR